MVATTEIRSHKKSTIHGKKQGKSPKATLNARISPSVIQKLDDLSIGTDYSKSQLTEALITKALESPKWVHIEHYDHLPADKRSYVIFDCENSMVEMGLAENLYELVAQHPKLEQYIVDKYRIIYFA
jgi:hypothetical protein